MKKSKILLLFKFSLFIIFIFNTVSILRFNKNYSINKKVISNVGVVTSVKKEEKQSIVSIKANYNIIGYLNFNNNIKIGDVISFTYIFKDIFSVSIFNGFNYYNYLKSINVYGTITITSYKKVEYNKFYALRSFIDNLIENKKSKAYLKTFIMSDKSLIDKNVKSAYSNNGVLHMLCVSGFHVLFLFEIIKTLTRKLKLRERNQNILLIIFAILYLNISSYPVSLQRAFLFYFLNYYNLRFDFKLSKNLIFAITFNICLFNHPYLIFNTGFWYTFILSLFLTKFKFKSKNTLLNSLIISLMAFMISMPLTVFLNYRINLMTIFVNSFLLVLSCYIIYPMCFLALLFNPFDHLLLKVSKIFELINLNISKVKFLVIIFPRVSLYFVVLMYLFLLIITYKKSVILILMYILFLVLLKYSIYFDSNSYIYFIDVKQGDMSILVSKYHSNVTIIDTGGLQNNNSLFKNISSFLYSIGVTKIDNLILTHGDYDHMGEAINLVNNFKVEKVIFNCGPYNDLEKELIKVLDKKKIKYYSCTKELNVDNNKLYFLQTKEYDNENDNSNVIYTELNNYKFLFMGDASTTTEKEMLNKYNLPEIDVLKVGHHGSKTSSSKEFVDEINPRYSIISVGKNNRYGHPNKEVLENLDDSKIYRTDQDGSIMFRIKNSKLKIETCSP